MAEAAPFRHFLLTRFYLQNPGAGYDGTQQLDWLEERLRLFETFCYPSVMAQTEQNFTWLLACRKRVPRAYRKRLAAFERENVVVTYKNRTFAGVEKRLKKARYLITSRLDNDDVICPHYIERVQAAFHEYRATGAPTTVQNFGRGYMLDLASGRLFSMESKNRQYGSLFVDLHQHKPLSVYHRDHALLHLEHPFMLDDHAAWMTVVHENNVANSFRGREQDLKRHVVASPHENGTPTVQWERIWECARPELHR